jgi:hypothetical protein
MWLRVRTFRCHLDYLKKKRDIMIEYGWAGEEEDKSSRLPRRLSEVDRESRRRAVCGGKLKRVFTG